MVLNGCTILETISRGSYKTVILYLPLITQCHVHLISCELPTNATSVKGFGLVWLLECEIILPYQITYARVCDCMEVLY